MTGLSAMVLESAAEQTFPGTAGNAGRARHQARGLVAAVAAADALTISSAVALASTWQSRVPLWPEALSPRETLATHPGPWMVLSWVLALAVQGGYSRPFLGTCADELRRVLIGSMLTAGSTGLFCYLVQPQLSRGFVLLGFAVGTPLLLAERCAGRRILHALRARGHLLRKAVAVGSPAGIVELVAALERARYAGYDVVGACVPGDVTLHPGSLPVPVLGSPEKAGPICDEMGADTVVVVGDGCGSAVDLRRMAWELDDADIDLVVVPNVTDVAGPRIHLRPVAGLPLLHVERSRAGRAGGAAKRAFDLVVASAMLLASLPLLLVAAIAIKAHDGGPVLFRQTRNGWRGGSFRMLKFRSMVVDAESRIEEVRHLNHCDAVLFKAKCDPRVTPVGRWLRRYSIDELPQLVNVLRGEMSLVGPRPPLPTEVDEYDESMHRRLMVRPGITGLWQVSGRSELSWQESVRLDLYYVDNWSMLTDLAIIARTLKAVMAPSGAF